MKKKIQLGQIIVEINKDPKSLDKFYKVVNKLNDIGYELDNDDIQEEIEDADFFFLTIDKDEKWAIVDTSITAPACMTNFKRRPVPISWLLKDFDKIMSNKTKESYLKALEKLSFKQFNN